MTLTNRISLKVLSIWIIWIFQIFSKNYIPKIYSKKYIPKIPKESRLDKVKKSAIRHKLIQVLHTWIDLILFECEDDNVFCLASKLNDESPKKSKFINFFQMDSNIEKYKKN